MTLMNNNDQSNNSIGAGNIINGNLSNNGEINNIANQIFFHPPSRAISNIEKVYNELKSKIKNNEDISDHLDYINHYLFRYTNISKTDLRSLDKKLIDANREDDIEEALYFKESAAKFIMKYQQNTSVQYIIASILALIKKDFMHYITPLINDNSSITEVNKNIDIYIIKPIEEIISNTDLSLHFNQVNNLLYFLAGNCHICWDKKC